MVDVKTGTIYELPLDEENSNRGVYHDNNHNIFFKPTSRLFICYASTANADEKKVNLAYHFYWWDEAKKGFQLLGTKKTTTALIAD